MLYDFFEEYQNKSPFNIFFRKFIISSSIPLLIVIIFLFLNYYKFIKTEICFIIIITSIIIYFIFGLFIILSRRGEFHKKESKSIKKMLLKYQYFSEKKINYLIQICNEKIESKNKQKDMVTKFIVFIIPIVISIVALFQIKRIEEIFLVLITLSIILVVILIVILNLNFFREFIGAFFGKSDVDYEYIKYKLYDILLNDKDLK